MPYAILFENMPIFCGDEDVDNDEFIFNPLPR